MGCNPAVQAEFLCAWNAFALQLLADRYLAPSERSDSIRDVPAVIARQASIYYTEVQTWLSRANQAQSNSNYRLQANLPVNLPPWFEDKSYSHSYLEAMYEAMHSLRLMQSQG